MRLYYTGAQVPNAPQLVPENSLGGYMASTPIPNDHMNNLFGDVSQLSLQANGKELRGIILKNITSTNVFDVTLDLVYPEDPNVIIEVAAVGLGVDHCGVPVMEEILNQRSLPLTGKFYRPATVFAKASLVVQVPASNKEVITILIDSQKIGVTPAFVGSPSLQATAEAVSTAINDTGVYQSVVHFDAGLGEYSVVITALDFGPSTKVVSVINAGAAYLHVIQFAGDQQRSLNIGNLIGGAMIGLWIRKTLRPELGKKLTVTQLQNQPTDFNRALQLFISWT